MLVDTLSSEIIQDKESAYLKSNGLKLKDYGTHVVSFWVMYYKKSVKNKKSVITKMIEKITVDTIKNQYQSADMVTYQNNKVIDSDNITYDWRDIIPGTMAEKYVEFGKAINNSSLMLSMYLNALQNKKYTPLLSPTE